jgi:hypothetical protein
MPAATRVRNQVFVLVPFENDTLQNSVRTAQRACRIAHARGMQPMSPLLYFLTFLSEGELGLELKNLSWTWLRRSDRIWLFFPSDSENLDSTSYRMLDRNYRREQRRPVYQVHQAGDDFHPIPMTREEVKELLNSNLTAGVASSCGI